jgi:hypothetical protein
MAKEAAPSDKKPRVQDLLRFLTISAKIPLRDAMKYAAPMFKDDTLGQISELAKQKPEGLAAIVQDRDHAKAIVNAAKRVSKPSSSSPKKRRKTTDDRENGSDNGKEGERREPEFPTLTASSDLEEALKESFTINRAPYMLIFAYCTAKHVYAPLSSASALSLAHCYTTANAISKGRSIGIMRDEKSPQDDLSELLGGSTQPIVNLMGRELYIIRGQSDESVRAIDIPGLKKKSQSGDKKGNNVPIYTPESAFKYLERSFGDRMGKIVAVLDAVFDSWIYDKDDEDARLELNKRSYGWYCDTRPEVPYGQEVLNTWQK